MKKTILLILDGWGNGKPYSGNAINLARKPNFDALYARYPYAELKTSGEDVGLPEGQMGNSEVGHMNIGAGRVVYQQLVLINKSFREKKVNENHVLNEAIQYARSHQKNIHLIGLVSNGGVHSSLSHVKDLCSLLQEKQIRNFYIHAFTDGRDTDPKSGIAFLKELNEHLQHSGGQIASVVGRYYAMDRDKRWERVKLAYDLLVNGIGEESNDLLATINKRYAANETDEFLKPIIANKNATIKEGDVVICFNFRTDRGREITMALTQQDFHEHNMHKINLHYISLTEYDKTFKNVKVLFPDIELNNTMGEVLEQNGCIQVRIAETEKYPHVTFFFSGGREQPFIGETRHMAPSPKVATYDLQPEMSADMVCDFTLQEIEKAEADFICVNFANPDMVGHTGVVEAEIKAIEKVDECLGKVVEAALAKKYSLLVTADHGNGEYMINESDGTPNTAHTTNKVPCLLIEPQITQGIKDGRLADIAPTLLTLMDIKIPHEMNGNVLLYSGIS
ncbi:MAG: 2,3-bisphosphoglycerate-independent phosphoglycerate mutase [Bacteroidota bacterium]|jgi:2,3-bisphosphoglycerate-independent phosphoglycerate mutase|nr:2,3-bisphosphoglycerate-independent phosphoglycerate mutase [Sphingobacteriales bacterium]